MLGLLNNEFIVDSQQLFYINLIIGILLLIYFLMGKSSSQQKPPTKLNLRAGSGNLLSEREVGPVTAQSNLINSDFKARQVAGKKGPEILEPEFGPVQKSTAKELGVFFMYNGHDWEAYDVLGVPRGALLVDVTKAYQGLLKNAESSTLEFYETAYTTILKKHKRDRL